VLIWCEKKYNWLMAYQPPASNTFLSQQISQQQPTSSTSLKTNQHQPPAKRTS
jgi:hypothetical protein